ncbi:MAG: GntR family transcriptional regulator [Pseudorhodobacter sp. PARRP1]|nr:MAG: GntR family transcriptional regulator [Pseudorhodobacter sp. PARRP1]
MLQSEDAFSQDPIAANHRLRPLDMFAGSLGSKVYQTLRQAILSLSYRPGEILRKPEICAELGVSRSPVSDAVARLASEGLVDVVPQAGTYVARFSMDEIREGAFVREAIELQAIERVAETITDEQLVTLRRNITVQAALLADGDFPGFYQLDGEMHELIRSFTGYRKLSVVAETAWVHVERARRLVLPVDGRVQATLDEHRAILAAVEARDPQAARAAMRVHLSKLLTYLEPLERSHPELFNP